MRIHVQFAAATGNVPSAETIRQWVEKSLPGRSAATEITVRIVDEAEGCELNERWRGAHGPTNVLAFPIGDDDIAPHMLGDVVVCAPVVEFEAERDGKALLAHWAHLVVHGTLHLAGYDHEDAPGASAMEAAERTILSELGYSDPYQ